MSKTKTLQDLFKRYRRPGDLLFALSFLLIATFLVVNIPYQTTWVERTKTYAQPAFWPTISLAVMFVFSAAHLIGALVSPRIVGRFKEFMFWVRSVEFALWFMLFVWIVPIVGYLPSSIFLCTSLSYRLGYRSLKWMLTSAMFGSLVVVIFRGFLHVKIPAGKLYELLPSGVVRSFIMTYL